MKNLPIDRTREFRESDYPHDPEAYAPLNHFVRRVREEERFVDGEIINACFNDGDLRDNNDGCACFRKVWGKGVAYYLVAGFHEQGYRVAVTIWPHVHHRGEAIDSGVWNDEQLDAIEALNEETDPSFNSRWPEYGQWMKQQSEQQV